MDVQGPNIDTKTWWLVKDNMRGQAYNMKGARPSACETMQWIRAHGHGPVPMAMQQTACRGAPIPQPTCNGVSSYN